MKTFAILLGALLAASAAAAVPLDALAVQRTAREALLAALGEAQGWRDVALDEVALEPLEVEPGELALAVRRIDAHRIRPRQRVWVDVMVDGRFQRSVGVAFGVRARRLALRAVRPVAANSALPVDALVLAEIDPFGAGPALPPVDADAGWITTRPLKVGEIVQASALRGSGRVERGQAVQLVLRENGIAVRDTGTALDAAQAGQLVRVMGRRTTQAMLGRVAADGSVLLVRGDAR